MTLEFTTPGLEPYLVLGQELFRRVYSEDSPEDINSWLAAQLQRLSGATTENARMMWEDSFTVYEQIMDKRKALALLPEAERHILTWPWQSWANLLIDRE